MLIDSGSLRKLGGDKKIQIFVESKLKTP